MLIGVIGEEEPATFDGVDHALRRSPAEAPGSRGCGRSNPARAPLSHSHRPAACITIPRSRAWNVESGLRGRRDAASNHRFAERRLDPSQVEAEAGPVAVRVVGERRRHASRAANRGHATPSSSKSSVRGSEACTPTCRFSVERREKPMTVSVTSGRRGQRCTAFGRRRAGAMASDQSRSRRDLCWSRRAARVVAEAASSAGAAATGLRSTD